MTKLPKLTYEPKNLQLDDAEFDLLHKKVAGRSARVSVDAETLRHLLHDHSALYQRLEEVDRHLRHPEAGKPLSEAPSEPQPRRGRRVDPLLAEEEDLIG